MWGNAVTFLPPVIAWSCRTFLPVKTEFLAPTVARCLLLGFHLIVGEFSVLLLYHLCLQYYSYRVHATTNTLVHFPVIWHLPQLSVTRLPLDGTFSLI